MTLTGVTDLLLYQNWISTRYRLKKLNKNINIVTSRKNLNSIRHCKNVIYTIGFGKRYFDMAKMCAISIREKGKFNGDVLIFTDLNEKSNNYYNVISVSTVSENLKHMKIICGKKIDIKKYHNIAFVDADIMFCRKINSELFDGLQCGKVKYVVESQSPLIHSPAHNAMFKYKDLNKFSCHGINSGFFVINSKYIKKMLDIWSEIIKTGHRYRQSGLYDQPAFNYMIYNNIYKGCKYNAKIKYGHLGNMPKRLMNKFDFIHFTLNSKNKMKSIFKKEFTGIEI